MHDAYQPCGGGRRGQFNIKKYIYFGGEPIESTEVESRVGKPKNGKAVGKDEITGEIIKGGGDRVVY